ncbi:hypothetical protein RM543_04345 [Roseicyclus sp. F158]|uniref:Membrane protein YjdF n=1 Tax=Tropicimonas omnivorans TaxID=3075590 RepID=A0ABU3DDV4_9RHOB|nr:hypothetical protein [Roseicyclus sp. F158]MDT0681905.1 hypothetical protein [Roseicyclus sp. F158]
MKFHHQPLLVWAIWLVLTAAAAQAAWHGHWSILFLAVSSFMLTLAPSLFVSRFDIVLPAKFLSGVCLFVFATLFLGEAFDFYERFWWWDMILHGASAVGFGIVGFVFLFFLFEGDRYAAPAGPLAMLSFCFAVSIGAVWEIFEFVMDQTFGMNMQKSGLVDTMWDLIVDCLGAGIAALAGYLYLKRREGGFVSDLIEEFIDANRRRFSLRRGRQRLKPGTRGEEKWRGPPHP